MAAGGDIRIAQNGGQGNVKLHPYLVALVRWCVSCVWSTATVVLHRLMTRPLPLAALIPPPRFAPKKQRAVGTDHLHPEPKVECVVLHQPADHQLDVIFVHGLYGSLGNTWRQGDWRPKYKMEPDLVPLIDRKLTNCECEDVNETNIYEDEMSDVTFYEDIEILPENNMFITEKFYNNTLLDQVEVIDNYEVQAEFVRDLFKKENINNCDNICDSNICKYNNKTCLNGDNICTFNEVYLNETVNRKCDAQNYTDCDEFGNEVRANGSDCCKCKKMINVVESNESGDDMCNNDEVGVKVDDSEACKCKINENRSCEVGCGCVCDECYSACWPKDWIKEDYPGARVLSINYTSDPYLWRPLWVKENKRLRLHERAEQMTEQLLELEVGRKPIIWVGHSKGVFIKQIYCEAYEAYLKTQKDHKHEDSDTMKYDENVNNNDDYNNENVINDTNDYKSNNDNITEKLKDIENNMVLSKGNNENVYDEESLNRDTGSGDINGESRSSNSEEDFEMRRRGLWSNSVGFMFYSVPHRGSLADFKTPITARSIELLEISKDCALVLSLQERWLQATSTTRPAVRSLVETTRTLMSVLWLRIVSVHSADAGIGALYGVSVDHREICKPSSRHCMLYTELMTLMKTALNKCRCQ
ncbi:LOW QUALITY PROTEIN: uncharacterized protein ACR2FA_007322 [Aphomia sociella]